MLDELHRTGAKEWGNRLNALIDNQTENTKVLGITATPRRDVDGINMASEMAERLGYTNREAVNGKHIAMNMSLTNAIRMGLVVNPKLVTCAYNLKEDGSLEKLKGRIDQIKDIQKQNEKLEEYEELRRSIENADGISEILQANVKKGGKYIVFLPIIDEIEDEDGNVIGRKTGKDKIADYEKQIGEYFKDSDIVPSFHSMLGEYGDKDNERRLEEFQNKDTDETEFMLVMNKANEGLHLDRLDGIIWLRPMDENSKILYLQQLGRVIYSEEPDNPTKDEDRPIVIDLVNNTLKVNWENEITEQDDIELLTIIVDWVERHDGTLPDINSTDKEERGYASVLKEIQNKYKEYLDDNLEDLEEKQIKEIEEIISLGSLIELWESKLSEKIVKDKNHTERSFSSKNRGPFELAGILKDFADLGNEIDEIDERTAADRFIEKLEKLQMLGIDISKITQNDTIKTVAEKSEIKVEEIEKIGLDPDDRIGNAKRGLLEAFRGTSKRKKPTEEQVKKLLQLGINLEKDERDRTQEFIEKLEKLQEIGVDVSKMIQIDTIRTLVDRSGIEIEEIERIGLNPDDRIGRVRANIADVFRGKKKGKIPTEEQVNRLLELGINLEKGERDRTQEFIEKLEKLQEIGVDVSKMLKIDTIGTLVDRSGIKVEEIEKIGLNPEDRIGNTKQSIAGVFRGRSKGKVPTEGQVKRLLELGISLEKGERNRPQEFIEKLEKLQMLGVDISKMVWNDTIKSLAEKSGIRVEEIEKIGLNPDNKIGSTRDDIVKIYRGLTKRTKPTEEQVKRLLELGINLEKGERDRTQEFIEKLEKLQEIGVDVSRIFAKDTIKNLAEKSGIKEEEIKKIGLNPNDRIGNAKQSIAGVFRGIAKGKMPTEEQVKRLLELGISLEKGEGRRDRTQEYIEKLEKLQEIGVDVSKMLKTDTIRTLVDRSGIEIEEIEKLGLNPDDRIGITRSNIVSVFRGTIKGRKPTEEQVKKLLELGISLEKRERTGREIAEASISSLKDIEMADREDVALTALVEKTKEGGIKANEQP